MALCLPSLRGACQRPHVRVDCPFGCAFPDPHAVPFRSFRAGASHGMEGADRRCILRDTGKWCPPARSLFTSPDYRILIQDPRTVQSNASHSST